MKKNFFKGDAEFTMQVLIMAIFGVAVALVLFVVLGGKPQEPGARQTTTTTLPAKGPEIAVSSFDLGIFPIFSAIILLSNYFRRRVLT